MPTEKEKQLFERLHDSRKEDAKVFKKPQYRNMWRSVVDKYPETAHFVYELLQNADDAQATQVEIELRDDGLVFRHNGSVPFDIIDVDEEEDGGHASINAITSAGNSTKADNGNTIGKFGVGFKAVFQYTDVPYIYDDNFWFRIEDIIVPQLLDSDFEGRREGETLFYFPFKQKGKAYPEILDRLNRMGNPIMFLHQIERVVWTAEGKQHVISKEIIPKGEYDGIRFDLVRAHAGEATSTLLMFTKAVDVPDAGQHDICVGYRLTEDGEIDIKTPGAVHCFFPTSESTGLPIVCHAPFMLTDNRQQMKPDSTTNDHLVPELIRLHVDAIEILCQRKDKQYIDTNIFKLVPMKRPYYVQTMADRFYEVCRNKIRCSKLLLCQNGQYIQGVLAYSARPISMLNCLKDEQLQDLTHYNNVYMLSKDICQAANANEDIAAYLDAVGVECYDAERLAKDISPEFMGGRTFKWVLSFYSFIRNDARRLWRVDKDSPRALPFRNAPIVKTQGGEWVAAYKDGVPNVFIPRSTNSKVAGHYNYLDDEYCADESAVKFLREMGLKEPDQLDYITNHVLGVFDSNGDDETQTWEQHDAALWDVIDYYCEQKEETARKEYIERLQGKLVFVDHEGNLRSASKLYDKWERQIASWVEKANLHTINEQAYPNVIGTYGKERFCEFLHELGMHRTVEVQPFTNNYPNGKLSCTYEDSTKYNYADDKELPGLDTILRTIVRNGDDELAKELWQFLAALPAGWHTAAHRWFYYNDHYRPCKSEIWEQLQGAAWLLDGKKPSEVTREQLVAGGYTYSKPLFDILEIQGKATLEELGVSEEDIERVHKGELVEQLGLTDEDLRRCAEEKRRKEARRRGDTMPATSRVEMHSSSITDFADIIVKSGSEGQATPQERKDDGVEKLLEKQAEEVEQATKKAELTEIAENAVRYSKEWFEALLGLESIGSAAEDTHTAKGEVKKITFEKVEKEEGSERIYVFRNPSQDIPLSIEELDEITVRCVFSGRVERKNSFEFASASLHGWSLRLKASVANGEKYAEVEWGRCIRATIEIKEPFELQRKLLSAFRGLALPDGFNLKEHLKDNVSFIFGPPGTGKTTHLAQTIIDKMQEPRMRILVLAPTNAACDELAAKIVERDSECPWLGRFVATEREELDAYVAGRESLLYQESRCCIISTMARLCFDGFNGDEGFRRLTSVRWDMVICDEASMIPLADMAHAIYAFDGTPIVIAGDPKQIPPISIKEWGGENIYTMVRLDRFDEPRTEPIQFGITNLDTQYRSVPCIGELFSRYAYGGLLKHARGTDEECEAAFGGLTLRPITFVEFRVDRYDTLFCPRRLGGSPVHLYSALLTAEMCAHMARERGEPYTIGVVCPYKAQAQLIESLIRQTPDLPPHVSITVGTVHRFQGGQCRLMIVVLNPPRGLKGAADRIFLNDEHIINVAISRAQDHLCVLMPHQSTDGFDRLVELRRILHIASGQEDKVKMMSCDKLEEIIFGAAKHIESNAFVTNHQTANVYCDTDLEYEIRIDENSVDIQRGR